MKMIRTSQCQNGSKFRDNFNLLILQLFLTNLDNEKFLKRIKKKCEKQTNYNIRILKIFLMVLIMLLTSKTNCYWNMPPSTNHPVQKQRTEFTEIWKLASANLFGVFAILIATLQHILRSQFRNNTARITFLRIAAQEIYRMIDIERRKSYLIILYRCFRSKREWHWKL